MALPTTLCTLPASHIAARDGRDLACDEREPPHDREPVQVTGPTLRRAMRCYPTGVAVVTTERAGEPFGLAVNSLVSVSLNPALILFCADRCSTTWPIMRTAGHFTVNILSAGQSDLCRRFADKRSDRFAGLPFFRSAAGAPRLDDALAWLDCSLERVDDGGDHFIVVARVTSVELCTPDPPLVFYQGDFHLLTPIAASPGGRTSPNKTPEVTDDH